MNLINKYKNVLLFILTGMILGFAYWYFIGCSGGTCPITSNWYSSALYGGLFGFLLSDFKLKKTKRADKNEQFQSNN